MAHQEPSSRDCATRSMPVSCVSWTGQPSHASACSRVPTRSKYDAQNGSFARYQTQAASYLAPFSFSEIEALTMGSSAS